MEFSITIHLSSFIIGLLTGTLVVGCATIRMFLDSRWDNGFSQGWKCGSEYKKEEKNEDHNA